MLAILVSELCLLVFELFFGDEPEIVDPETLVVVLARSHLLFLNGAL